jgi:hypothetical protein
LEPTNHHHHHDYDDVWWRQFSSIQQGLFVSGLSLGALLGSHLILHYFSNKIGRRMELRLCAILYLVGTGLNVLSGTVLRETSYGFYSLFLGRLVFGMGVGFIMHGVRTLPYLLEWSFFFVISFSLAVLHPYLIYLPTYTCASSIDYDLLGPCLHGRNVSSANSRCRLIGQGNSDCRWNCFGICHWKLPVEKSSTLDR